MTWIALVLLLGLTLAAHGGQDLSRKPEITNLPLIRSGDILLGRSPVPLNAGEVRIVVSLDDNIIEPLPRDVSTHGIDFAVRLSDRLQTGQRVRVHIGTTQFREWSEEAIVQSFILDERRGTDFDFFAALDFEAFGSSSSDDQTIDKNSAAFSPVAGADLSFRVAGRLNQAERALTPQFWLGVRGTLGQRSKELTCEAASEAPECAFLLFPRLRTVIQRGSSIEVAVAPKIEFWSIESQSSHMMMYIKGEVSMLIISSADDLEDLYFYGIGIQSTTGPFTGSFVEAGGGGDSLFLRNQNRRFKLNGEFMTPVGPGLLAFARINLDTDFASGSDRLRVYFGVRLNLLDLNRRFR